MCASHLQAACKLSSQERSTMSGTLSLYVRSAGAGPFLSSELMRSKHIIIAIATLYALLARAASALISCGLVFFTWGNLSAKGTSRSISAHFWASRRPFMMNSVRISSLAGTRAICSMSCRVTGEHSMGVLRFTEEGEVKLCLLPGLQHHPALISKWHAADSCMLCLLNQSSEVLVGCPTTHSRGEHVNSLAIGQKSKVVLRVFRENERCSLSFEWDLKLSNFRRHKAGSRLATAGRCCGHHSNQINAILVKHGTFPMKSSRFVCEWLLFKSRK